MPWDIENQEEERGIRFRFFDSHVDPATGKITYDEPEEDAEWVEIRAMGRDKLREIIGKWRKKVSEFALNPVSGLMERVQYFADQTDEQRKGEERETLDWCIVDWNLKDKSGKPIPTSIDNKVLIMKNKRFQRFFERCQVIASGSEKDRLEAEQKNLLSS